MRRGRKGNHLMSYTRALSLRVGALPVLLLTALVAVLYWPSVAALLRVWGSDRGTYSQGYLIAAVCVWMLAMRGREAAARLQPRLGALPVILGLGFVWLIGARAGIQTAEAILFPLILWVAIRASFGAAVARDCMFPCAFLVLAIPVWDPLSAPLQAITTHVAAGILALAQVPTRVTGNFIHINAGTFEVASGCSGLGMLLVGLATAGLYGEMQRQPASRRLLLFVLVAALSLVANWLRVAGIIYAGYLKGMNTYLVRDHYGFGWVVFAIMLIAFFPLARRLASAPAAPAFQPSAGVQTTAGHLPVAAALILVCLAVGPAWQLAADRREPPRVTADLPQDPSANWTGPRAAPRDWTPQFPGADAQRIGVYLRGEQRITAFTAAYAVQRHARKLVGYGVEILDEDERQLSDRRIDVAGQSVAEIEAESPGDRHAIVWLRYTVGARHFTSGWWAQLRYGWDSLLGSPGSSVMLLRAQCDGDCAAARTSLTKFVTDTQLLAGT
jgi:EpsI family protein